MAQARHAQAVRLLGVARRHRRALMMTTALQAGVVLVLSVPAAAQPASNARPMGGQVVAGAASISQAPTTTTISQSSQRAAVNWQSFNVGSQQSVQFQQPSASAATLNRVVGPNPSQIAGRITANGQVILVNQDGIMFYKGAQVNTGGLVVSTAGITNRNFMAGHMVFDQPGHPNARIDNAGTITVKQAGLAAFVAPQVANSGVISAKLGHVVLAGAQAATLDMYGDGLVSIDVTKEVKQVPVGPGGKTVTALVTNSGTVLADGGTVQITARAADGIIQNLIEASGHIQANSVGGHQGEIALEGVGGSITVAGVVSAQGHAPGTSGGSVELLADGGVNVAASARVNASGRVGGGVVAVGTTLKRAKGGPSVTGERMASSVTVAKGARIAANATGKGTGGRVAVLSSGNTEMDGTISATGGPLGGDGGFVEVSGATLGLDGSINAGAARGNMGTILFDPGTLDIVNAGSGEGGLDGTLTTNGGTINPGDGGTTGTSTVSNGAIEDLTGNLRLEATTSIDVQAPITLTTSGQALTLSSGGGLTLESGASITTKGNITLSAASTGMLTLNDNVSTTSGIVALSAGTGGISLNNVTVGAPTINITTPGSVSQGASGNLNASTAVSVTGSSIAFAGLVTDGGSGTTSLIATKGAISEDVTTGQLISGTLSGGATGSASLNGANTVHTLASFSAAGFSLSDGADLTITGNVSGGSSVSITDPNLIDALTVEPGAKVSGSSIALTDGAITIGGIVTDGGGGTTSLIATNGAIFEPATGQLIVGTLSGSAAESATLTGASPITNQIATLGAFSAAPQLSLSDAVDLKVNGGVTANWINFNSLGTITEVAGGQLNAVLLSGTAAAADFATANDINYLAASQLRIREREEDPVDEPFLTTNGGFRLNNGANALIVAGTVQVANGQTLDLMASSLTVDHSLTSVNVSGLEFTLSGSLIAGASVLGSTVTPGEVALQTDDLTISSSMVAVSAPDGMVAIAPLTAGNIISVDPSPVLTAGTLSLGINVLNLISTTGVLTSSPLGVHELALGSTDGGASITAGGIVINTAFDVTPIASTLSLFAAKSEASSASVYSGLITQGAADPVTVDALSGSGGVLTPDSVDTGAVGATSIDLRALNAITKIGVLSTEGGTTSTATGQGNLLATGSITVYNNSDLQVHATVHAGDDPGLTFHTPGQSETADIEAAPSGASGPGTLTVSGTGTVWAGTNGKLSGIVNLSGGSSTSIGEVDVDAPGAVFASNGGSGVPGTGTVSVQAGFSGATANTACTSSDCAIVIAGTIWGNQGTGTADSDLAGTVRLNAASSIDERAGAIGGYLLTGSAGGFVDFSGGGLTSPSQNRIATLGSFNSNGSFNLPAPSSVTGAGFLLRDARNNGLTVTGTVQDHGVVSGGTFSTGVEITVRPAVSAQTADLVLQSSSIATSAGTLIADALTGTIDIEATGNVYEQSPPSGGFASTLSANALFAQAGVLPRTEIGGTLPGTIPAADAVTSIASVWLANGNTVATLAGATATGNVFFLNTTNPTLPSVGDLTVGTVYAGAAARGAPAATSTSLFSNSGSIVPTAEIDAIRTFGSATLTIDGLVQAGSLVSGAPGGDVTLRAGDGGNGGADIGALTVNGSAVALTGPTFDGSALTAGGTVLATTSVTGNPVTGPRTYAVCSSLSCELTINGFVRGDNTVGLGSGSDISEPGTIWAGTLAGFAASFASLPGAGAPTANRIAQLGTFDTNLQFSAFPLRPVTPGLLLRDGEQLTVIGTVTDHGSVVAGQGSSGITIAVAAPGDGSAYGAADLILQSSSSLGTGMLSADAVTGTIDIEATGNVYEQGADGTAASALSANLLLVQAGAIPSTEPGGNTPGTIPAAGAVTSIASVWLANGNTVATLAGATATGNVFFLNTTNPTLPSVGDLTVGTVYAGAAATGTPAAASTSLFSNSGSIVPTAEIDAIRTFGSATLAVDGLVQAGSLVSGAPGGDVTLRAGDGNNGGADIGGLTINGSAVALTGPTFDSSALIAGGTVLATTSVTGNPITGTTTHAVCVSLNCELTINGLVRGQDTVGLASGSDIIEPGTIWAGTLTGFAASFASLPGAGAPTANQIAQLGTFDTNLNFSAFPLRPVTPGLLLRDGEQLTVIGTVTDHGSVVAGQGSSGISIAVAAPGDGSAYGAADLILQSSSSLGTGMLSADAVTGTIDIEATGNVYEQAPDGTAASALSANLLLVQAGAIPGTEPGGNMPGSIPASPVGLASITLGNANQVSTLADATATQDFLFAAQGALTVPVTGTVLAGAAPGITHANAQINAKGDLTIAGIVHSGQNGAAAGDVALSGADVFVNGKVFAADAGNVSVTANAGSIEIPGVIWGDGPPQAVSGTTALAATLSLKATTQINETGTVGASLLTGHSGGQANLPGAGSPTANVISQLGSFGAAGFSLSDSIGLTVTGPVNGAPSVSLVAPALTIPGSLSDGGGGTTSLIASNGTINETGTLIAGTLSGSATGSASLVGPANAITTLASLTAAGLTLIDSTGLTVTGPVNGAPAVSLTAPSLTIPGSVSDGGGGTTSLVANGGAINETGALIAGTLSGRATGSASLTGAGNAIATLGGFTAAGFTLIDSTGLTVAGPVNGETAVSLTAPSLTIPGAVSDGGRKTGTTTLTATTGVINETGALIAGTLTGSAAGAVTLIGNNTIGTLGAFTTAGTLTLDDAAGLTLLGPVSAGAVTLNVASVFESGALTTPLLTFTSAGTADLRGTNQIAEVNGFTAGQAVYVTDNQNLTLAGTMTSPQIVIIDNPFEITLANGASIVTGGSARPTGFVLQLNGSNDPRNNPAAFGGGVYLTDFTQVGTSFVSGINGGPSILEINATAGHNIRFDQNAGLRGPNTWLILELEPTQQASGNVFIKALDVDYLSSNATGGASLFGSINQINGFAAAGAGHIIPLQNARYQFNNCPIASVNCVILPVQAIPARNPLEDLSIGLYNNPNDDDELLLPIVTDKDY